MGPHRLRHALAAELLRHGAGLVAIGQVLRHQDLATTALYAKVDLVALRRGRPALAGNGPVSGLEQALADYLRLRRSLGHQLAEAALAAAGLRCLPRCPAGRHGHGRGSGGVGRSWRPTDDRRPDDGRAAADDRRPRVRPLPGRHRPGTEVPPLGLMPHRQRWRGPFIYSPADIDRDHERGLRRRSPRRCGRRPTSPLIGLLAASGLRIGEAIKLDRGDIDWAEGVLLIRESKFGKSRLVPLHATHACRRCADYAGLRDQTPAATAGSELLRVAAPGSGCRYAVVSQTFRRLVDDAGVGADAPRRPRLHDLRHTFAVTHPARLVSHRRGRRGQDPGAVDLPRTSRTRPPPTGICPPPPSCSRWPPPARNTDWRRRS